MIITKIVTIAEDILQALYQIGDQGKIKTPIAPIKPPAIASDAPVSVVTAIIVVFCLLCVPGAAWAHSGHSSTSTTTINNTTINPTAVVVTEKVQAGAEFDAPKLVHITKNLYLGIEGGKDMVYTNTSKGWFGFAKLTWDWTALDFTKKADD